MMSTVAGIIAEFNPLHLGHLHLLEETRRILGADTAIVCCVSGDFVQRGDLAVLRRQARARAAVLSGVDLVLELPLPWAVSSAGGFAEGGVCLLLATGMVDTLVFGSECGDTALLRQAAGALQREDFSAALREALSAGISFPAARQRAVTALAGDAVGAVLSRPNDLLGVEYCRGLSRHHAAVRPLAIPRQGAGHGSPPFQEALLPSASAVRVSLRAGEREKALSLMAPAMRLCYLEEEAAGRAPVFYEAGERAILYRLRSMSRGDFAALDTGREGLSNRLYRASREARSVREFLERAKTRRYPLSRLRRMLLRACLGLPAAGCPDPERDLGPEWESGPKMEWTPEEGARPVGCPAADCPIPYLRPLAMNRTGRNLLASMRRRAAVPVLTKAADVRKLGETAQRLFDLEAKAASLYTLCYPALSAASGGELWREGPWIAPD